MSDVQQAEATETPAPGPVVEPSGDARGTEAPPLTVKEHAALHSERKDAITPEERTKLEEKAAHHSEAQRREKDGKFTEGKVRHRAQSQQARPEDVPRIRELTARAKSAEDRLAAAEAEVARLKTQHAPPAQVAAAERKVEQAETVSRGTAADDPEPKEDDPKYEGDYGKFLRDVTKWETRQALAADRAASEQRTQQAKIDEAKTATIKTFAERLTTAGEKYDDFEDTLKWDAPWLAASGDPHPGYEALHEFILTDDLGPDVLHYLRSHPDEVDAILRVPPLQQVKRLTLLGQRFASPESAAAGATGAAPRQTVVQLPPKPPTPVRTGASKVVGAPPTDGSLSVMGHAKAFKYQR
jgi:hypothetical protein